MLTSGTTSGIEGIDGITLGMEGTAGDRSVLDDRPPADTFPWFCAVDPPVRPVVLPPVLPVSPPMIEGITLGIEGITLGMEGITLGMEGITLGMEGRVTGGRSGTIGN